MERFFAEAANLFARDINCAEIVILTVRPYACVIQEQSSQNRVCVSLDMGKLENFPNILKWLMLPEPSF